MDVLLFGPPGAGKGTQARIVSARLGVPHISTGDMMRAERESGSILGQQFSEYISSGVLVPDELVGELLTNRLRLDDALLGAVFDGYPRTISQCDTLDQVLGALGRSVSQVIFLQVKLEDVLDRIRGRRVCLSCGHVYHLSYNPPPPSGVCVECGGTSIEARRDDNEVLMTRRFNEYLDSTAPLLDIYKRRDLLSTIDGTAKQETVSKEVFEVIERLKDG